MKYIFHLLPIIPLLFQRYFATVAVVLLVTLPYIKVAKLRVRRDLAQSEADQADLDKQIQFWAQFTFFTF